MFYLAFNISYLFTVLFLVFFVIVFNMVYMFSMFYLKYLVILVYISGIVVFILYISCLCWNSKFIFNKFFLLGSLFMIFLYNSGIMIKFSDIGEFFWMFMFFSFLFNSLVMSYSLHLFKISGSLRF